jgi:hypothetical protein
MNDHDLNALLRRWSSETRLTDEEQRALALRISRDVFDRRQRMPVSAEGKRGRPGWAPGWAACGAAAAVALCVLGVMRHRAPPVAGDVDPAPPGAASVPADDRWASGPRLFCEMNALFADQFRWMAEFNGRVDMGVEPIAGGVADTSVPVQYRLTVLARTPGETTWRTAWSTDVLMRTEERVALRPGRQGGEHLALWVYPLEDGTMAVDIALSLAAPVRIASQTTILQEAGRPAEVFAWREGGTEYRAMQTVAVLEAAS